MVLSQGFSTKPWAKSKSIVGALPKRRFIDSPPGFVCDGNGESYHSCHNNSIWNCEGKVYAAYKYIMLFAWFLISFEAIWDVGYLRQTARILSSFRFVCIGSWYV